MNKKHPSDDTPWDASKEIPDEQIIELPRLLKIFSETNAFVTFSCIQEYIARHLEQDIFLLEYVFIRRNGSQKHLLLAAYTMSYDVL